jgi:hypothetical protein
MELVLYESKRNDEPSEEENHPVVQTGFTSLFEEAQEELGKIKRYHQLSADETIKSMETFYPEVAEIVLGDLYAK